MQDFSGGYDTSSRYRSTLYFDELEYRNSRVNRIWVDSNIRALPSITLENRIKFESNKQIEGTMYDNVFQPNDEIRTLAMVNKIVYTKQWGNFIFSPGVNFRLYKKARSESIQPLDHYLMRIPFIMFKYIISNDTGMYHVAGAFNKPIFVMWKDSPFEKNISPGEACFFSRKGKWLEDFKRWER